MVYELRDFLTRENIDIIARNVSALCEQEQDTDTARLLKKQIKEHKKAIENLFKALEIGDISEDITERIAQKKKTLAELERQLKVEEHRFFAPSADEIRFFLSQFKKGDVDSLKYRQGLVDMLVNKLVLYKNKLTVFCNIKDSQFDIPLDESSSNGRLVEAAGVEPASENSSIQGTTSVVCGQNSSLAESPDKLRDLVASLVMAGAKLTPRTFTAHFTPKPGPRYSRAGRSPLFRRQMLNYYC